MVDILHRTRLRILLGDNVVLEISDFIAFLPQLITRMLVAGLLIAGQIGEEDLENVFTLQFLVAIEQNVERTLGVLLQAQTSQIGRMTLRVPWISGIFTIAFGGLQPLS